MTQRGYLIFEHADNKLTVSVVAALQNESRSVCLETSSGGKRGRGRPLPDTLGSAAPPEERKKIPGHLIHYLLHLCLISRASSHMQNKQGRIKKKEATRV